MAGSRVLRVVDGGRAHAGEEPHPPAARRSRRILWRFLRGCIDGDGTILVYTDRQHVAKKPTYVYERLYVSLVSASRPFIEWITASIRTRLGVRGGIHTKRAPGRQPLYVTRFAKIHILHWIYYSLDVRPQPFFHRRTR